MVARALLVFVLLVVYFCGAVSPSVAVRRTPNIIIVLADDLGYNDLGCYWTPGGGAGSERIETPNIDRLASEGIRLTDFYAGAPVCTASRAALLTGCYPVRVGLSSPEERRAVLDDLSDVGLNGREVTLAELLRKRGYATACIGKWHLGHRPPFLPTRHGFQRFVGIMFRNERGTPLERNGTVIDTLAADEITSRLTDEAIRFIQNQSSRPFFLYLAYTAPHIPLQASERFRDQSARGVYGDVVMDLDYHLGRLLSALQSAGLDRKTLVIFTSDNGPAIGEGGGSAYPLQGGKMATSEGGVRVPCILRWPGALEPGRTLDAVVTAMDILPTVARLARAKLPEHHVIDGEDVWPLLLGREEHPARTYFYYNRDRLEGVRHGPWKLTFVRSSDGRQQRAIAGPLYDLAHDPGETNNVTRNNLRIVHVLRDLADKMRGDLGDATIGQPPTNARPAGHYETKAPSSK